MREPEAITKLLTNRFDEHFPSWARGDGSWPMRINLSPPSVQQRATDPVACHAWSAQWTQYSGPGEVTYTNLKFPTGTHSMPRQLVLSHPSQVAAANPDTHATWMRCGQRLIALQNAFPHASFARTIRRITQLTDSDFQRLVDTVAWIQQNPASGMYIRQLPIEGVHTKWLATHAGLVLAMLGTTTDDVSEEQSSPNAIGRLHDRLGLKRIPALIHTTILDAAIRRQVCGMKHISGTVEGLNLWTSRPDAVVILENKETGFAFTDDIPGVVVLHGHGFHVTNFPRITWVAQAPRVIYWGDIDGPGLEFLNNLRRQGVAAESILMNTTTLHKFQHLAVEGTAPTKRDLPHLTEPEQKLHEYLTSHARSTATGLLLEQERIPWPYAYQELTKALARPFTLNNNMGSSPRPAMRRS